MEAVFVKNIKKSIAAGMIISISAIAYITCENKYIGSVLFAFGLLTIVRYKLNLYTGYLVNFSRNKGYRKVTLMNIIIVFMWNFVGSNVVSTMSLFNSNLNVEKMIAISNAKLDAPLYWSFLSAIFCGIVMTAILSTENHKAMSIILGIPLFILTGFNHSIADMTYLFFTPRILDKWVYLFIVMIGNFVGGNLFYWIAIREDKLI